MAETWITQGFWMFFGMMIAAVTCVAAAFVVIAVLSSIIMVRAEYRKIRERQKQ